MAFNFKSLFVKEDEEIISKPEVIQPKAAPIVPVVVTGNINVQSQNDYNRVFDEVISTADIAKPGYREFAQGLKKMEGKPYTDQQKFENIFIGLDVQGVTPSKLEGTANQVINILQAQKEEFDRDISAEEEREVKAKQIQVETLQKENDELTKKLQENTVKIQQLNNEAIEASQHLNAEKSAFENTLNTRVGIIQDHINKIKLYLNATVSK